MTNVKQDPLIPFLIERFKRGAIVTHFGYEDEDNAMTGAGIDSAKGAIKLLDALGPETRLALLPLLEDPDWSIRVFAAGYLLKAAPERALPVLKQIKEECLTRARFTAFQFLWDHEHEESGT
jgi:hypothetical protein